MSSAADEVPWACLFVLFMGVVQLQFRYCVPVMLTVLKVVESALLVAVCRIWVQRDFLGEDFVTLVRQRVFNATEL